MGNANTKAWKCTIDEDYDVSSVDLPKDLQPDCDIKDWKNIGPLPPNPEKKMGELEMTLKEFSFQGEPSLQIIRKMDNLATYLYMNAAQREGITVNGNYEPMRTYSLT